MNEHSDKPTTAPDLLREAAPDLLDALKGLLDFIEIDALAMDPLALQIARAAVIKAEEGLQ